MPVVQLGDWLPDQAQLATGVVMAKNTVRTAAGYRPFGSAQAISHGSIPAPSPTLTMARNTANDLVIVAAGGDGNLYRFDRSALTWSKISSTAYVGVDNWYFVEFGNKLLASNGVSKIQSYDLSVGTFTFGDLSASAPQAKFITLVKDQIFAGSYPDATTGTMQLARVGWSAVNDPTNWNPDQTVLCDFQDNPDCGALMGLTGGAYGVALFEKIVKRITFVGPPVIYEFDPILNSHGCMAAGSVLSHLNFVFYLSYAGFMMFDGNSVTPIGAEQVDRYFFNDASPSLIPHMRVGLNPLSHAVMWVYAGSGNNGTNNACLIYNYAVQKWSHGDLNASCLSQIAMPGYTLDELDQFCAAPPAAPAGIDSLQASLDSSTWAGGSLFPGAMDYNGNLCNLTGPPNQAIIDTKELSLNEMRYSMLQALYPLIEGDASTVSAQVSSRSRNQMNWTQGPVVAQNAEGWIGTRQGGRFHRVRLFINGYWTHAIGVEYLAQPMGRR